MCEEYESLHDRSGRPDMVMGQSIVLSAIKTEVPLENDDPTNRDLLLQQYEERIERLSQQDRLSKFCMDAGFLSVVGPTESFGAQIRHTSRAFRMFFHCTDTASRDWLVGIGARSRAHTAVSSAEAHHAPCTGTQDARIFLHNTAVMLLTKKLF